MTSKNTPNFSPEDSRRNNGLMKKITLFLGFKGMIAVFLLLMFSVFCFQNIESTSVQFLFWKILEVSKVYLIAISISLGVVLGLLLGFSFNRARKKELSQ